jgi:hypothetical protein
MGIGELNIWLGGGTRLGRETTLGGESIVVGDGACCNLSFKIAARSVRADIVSPLTLVNGTSGRGLCKASVLSLDIISNRSVDDKCGP